MTKLEAVRACVFDAYGTLFDVHGPLRKLAAEIGPDADSISRLWRQKQLEYSWLRSLMGVHADFWHVTREALDYSLKQLDINEAGLADELMTLYLKLDAYTERDLSNSGLNMHFGSTTRDSLLAHAGVRTSYVVSPGVFQRYAQEHPQVGKLARQESLHDWQWVQKRFERLQLHRKQSSGLNIWTCEVTGPRKSRKLHGYLLIKPQMVFYLPASNNPYLFLIKSKTIN